MLTLMSALSGINLIHDCGYLASGTVGSLEMAVICSEIISMVSRIVTGIDVNDETLAMDVMREVGPKGSFLTHKHTVISMRKEVFIPKLFDRVPLKNGQELAEKALAELLEKERLEY